MEAILEVLFALLTGNWKKISKLKWNRKTSTTCQLTTKLSFGIIDTLR